MLWLSLFLPYAAAADLTVNPGESIQATMNEAVPGDVIVIMAGIYDEDLSTESDGTEASPITMRAEGEVIITAPGEVLAIDHAYWVFEDLIFDGQYGSADTLDIDDDANHLRLVRVEVRHSGRDCIDMGAPTGVSIIDSEIHHCLHYDADDDERVDAHGITGGAVQDLSILGTDIHTFSGDAVQFDPGREAPGWDNIVIRDCRFWLAPLTENENGFEIGQVTGENAIDTKTVPDGSRATLLIEDSSFWGFKDGIDFSNQAALLLKENVEVTISRVRIFDSEIGIRVRGPTDTRPLGARVRVQSSLLYNLDIGIRYEDDIEDLELYHLTFGTGVETFFDAAGAETDAPDVRNTIFLGAELPIEAGDDAANLTASVDDFIDSDSHDYHLAPDSPAIDAGQTLAGVETDLDNQPRIEGSSPDIGAFEYGHDVDTGDIGDTGEWPDTGDNDTPPDGDDTDTPAQDQDTGLDTEVAPTGIGAAGVVGELGGCGCASNSQRSSLGLVGLVLAAGLTRRRRSHSSALDLRKNLK